MECKCAETFAAECGCGSKAAEDAPIPSDPRVSPMDDGLHIPADSPALDLPRENAEIGGVDFKADSSPLPPDPRVSPLNEGLYTPSDTPEMAAEYHRSGTLIFIDLSGSTNAERADGIAIQDSFMADIKKMIKGADGETFTIIGFGSSGGDGRLRRPYGDFTRIICESATPAEVRKSLKDGEDRHLVPTSLWRSMGGTRFPSMGLMEVILTELYSGDRSSYPSKTIILTDAFPFDMLPASWDAEAFGAEMKDSHLTVSQRVLRAIHDQYPALYEDIEEGTQFPPEELEDTGDYDDAVDIAETMQLVRLLSADIRNASEPVREFYDITKTYPRGVENEMYAESFGAESKFDKLAKEIAEEYEEKGKSPKEAREIGEATAAKIGRAKFGKKKFAKMGQKAEDDIDFDEAKADRNKDGRISDWERAVGNAVAKGIRDHKGAESAFDRLEDEVADEYEEKGMSDKEAKRIGAAVAYEQGVKKYGKKIMSEAARKGVSARSLERRAEVGPHVPTRIGATTTTRGVVKTFDSIPAGDGHVVGQFTPDMDYAPSGMYGAESITDSIAKGFGSVLGIMSGLIIGGFAMNAVALLKSDDEN